jgi:MoxR-like ATPase
MNFIHRDQVLAVIDKLASDYLQGKIRAIRMAMIGLLAGGHLLIEDVPGLGKTTLALALSSICGLDFGRVQATSDLMPADITGLSIFDRTTNQFRFIKGPIFNHLVLIDEINRTLPKTQSALLEAMEERRVTVEGKTYRLPDPFMVIATQNPLEQAGTYPLPESQMDRFLLVTDVGYPPAELESRIIQQGGVREQLSRIQPLMDHQDVARTRTFIQEQIQLNQPVADYIQELLASSRRHAAVSSGISTRGGLALAAAARAAAYLEGRAFVVPEDVQRVAVAVLSHRLILPAQQLGVAQQEVVKSLLAETAVPIA